MISRVTLSYEIPYPPELLEKIRFDEEAYLDLVKDLPRWVIPRLTPFRHEDCPYVRKYIGGIDINGIRTILKKEAKLYGKKLQDKFSVEFQAKSDKVVYSVTSL